jgi:hypothetical protein
MFPAEVTSFFKAEFQKVYIRGLVEDFYAELIELRLAYIRW